MLRWILSIASVAALSLASACGAAHVEPTPTAAVDPTPESGKTLVIAELGKDASKKIRRFQPLADHLAAALAPQGYTAGEVQIVPTMDELTALIKSGAIDVIVDSPYPAMLIAERSGAQPILRRWKGGDAEYFGVIFAFADRGISTLADLDGRYLALENDLSTSGYFLPLAQLISNKLTPVHREARTDPLAEKEVGYLFTGDEDNTVQWVLTGKADAGAVDRKTYADLPAETRARMVVVAETEHVARHVVLVRPDLQPAVLAALKAELERMDTTEAGRTVLEAFEKTARFDNFPAEASLDRMRSLFLLVGPPR